MTKATVIKLYKYFQWLASGDFKERDFDKDYGKEGRMTMGSFKDTKRKDLIMSDAARHLEDIVKKNPWVVDEVEKEKPKKSK